MFFKSMNTISKIVPYFHCFPYFQKYVHVFKQVFIYFLKYVSIFPKLCQYFGKYFHIFKYFENIFLNISMERALRATEDRGINVGVPFCPWSQGGAPFFLERTFRARHREGGSGKATAPPTIFFTCFI